MPVRVATSADEPALAKVATAAFFNEGLFGNTIHPRRHEFPEDVEIFWHEVMRKHFMEKDEIIIVTTTTENEQEKLTGFAIWQRQGNDEGAKKIRDAWVDPGPNPFPELPSTNNRALDPTKKNILEEAYPHFDHHWHGERKNNWYLSLCGTDAAYQGCGYGKQLVSWGIARAREENVHASVIASENNATFYQRCGFDDVVGNGTEGEGNPLKDVGGGDILFMWPKKHSS